MVLKYVHVQQGHMDAEMDRLARENAARPHTSGNQAYFAGLSVNDRNVVN
jgi:hypothetical protein